MEDDARRPAGQNRPTRVSVFRSLGGIPVPRLARLFLIFCAAAAFFVPQVLARPAAAATNFTPPQKPQVTNPANSNPLLNGNSTTATTNGSSVGDPSGSGSIKINLGNLDGSSNGNAKPGSSVVIILLLTLLSVAPALLVMMTSFTRIVIVLSLTRNAIGLTSIPPNQVVIGLSLFLSLFVMFPTLSQMNDVALQPLLKGNISYGQAYDRGQKPLKAWMLKQTRTDELNMFIKMSKEKPPATRDKVSMATLVPAFVLSELKSAFIIGFVVFIPFLIIDLVISSALMSMGMFMLPPVLVSLPFKLLLFVMVDGWALIVQSLVTSFH
jgi:flagellar biosynthesis protein FliP